MSDSLRDQAIALAGVVQACQLVDQLARSGQADSAAVNTLIHSLFEFEPRDTESIFKGINNVRPGLQTLNDMLGNRDRYPACLRYTMGVLHLQKQLARRGDLQEIIHTRLRHAEKKFEYFSSDINQITSSIAAIYQDTISTFKFRIQVQGSLQHLQNTANAERIRALLLAGIRCAHLWRQLGGSRWQLLLARGRLQKTVQRLLAD
ncbi:MAG TPA: high frequency lysogenization protein HflD [Spongiibacteraceae bacterium]|jgi:high frequency lysogenization protein|nr:high frequency lysogenization protein HflD [Spongiibacteraceae bacterium]HUH38289.1 high frequency lysogenization protein HflD [Spongiibacteraceae bacterium]